VTDLRVHWKDDKYTIDTVDIEFKVKAKSFDNYKVNINNRLQLKRTDHDIIHRYYGKHLRLSNDIANIVEYRQRSYLSNLWYGIIPTHAYQFFDEWREHLDNDLKYVGYRIQDLECNFEIYREDNSKWLEFTIPDDE
jgi:hypothetical protein